MLDRSWSVCRGRATGRYYIETNASVYQRGNDPSREIVARGLTEAEALAHAYALNNAAGGGPGAGERLQSGGRL